MTVHRLTPICGTWTPHTLRMEAENAHVRVSVRLARGSSGIVEVELLDACGLGCGTCQPPASDLRGLTAREAGR